MKKLFLVLLLMIFIAIPISNLYAQEYQRNYYVPQVITLKYADAAIIAQLFGGTIISGGGLYGSSGNNQSTGYGNNSYNGYGNNQGSWGNNQSGYRQNSSNSYR